jgi:hypothetical protein
MVGISAGLRRPYHLLERGYWLKFEIERTETNVARPHGLRYSFTLHGPTGKRLIGFDNAHAVRSLGSPFKKGPPGYDHWHRTETDVGRLTASSMQRR